MTVRQALDYCAAFRSRWNVATERSLLDQFRLDERQKTTHLSKGQRTQLALITAICPEPQWAVKAATTLTLALVLGVGVPMLVSFLFSYPEGPAAWHPRRVKEMLAAAVLLTSCSLYVSSLSSSAVRAMVNSIPIVIAGWVFVTGSMAVVMSIGYRVIAGPYGQNRIVNHELLRSFESGSVALYVGLAMLIAAMFLWFAFSNHRSMERRVPRVALQVLALVFTAACCLVLPLVLYTS